MITHVAAFFGLLRADPQQRQAPAPCPFCGSTSIGEVWEALACENCGAMGPTSKENVEGDALKNWNRRAP